MSGFHENTNPYAAPEPVEEDAPGYDLRKIAGLYNRLGWVLKWFVPLWVIDILLFVVFFIFLLLADFPGSSTETYENLSFFFFCLILPVHLVAALLLFYGLVLMIRIAWAMKYRTPALLLIILGAIYFPFTILVWILLRRRTQQILRGGGVEIINGKVDLTQIPVVEDY